MSGKLVGEVLNHAPADLTPAERLVLVSLAEDAHDGDRTSRFQASAADLSRRTGYATQTVYNALDGLKRRGLIRPLVARVQKGGKHQEYTIAKLSKAHRYATLHDAAHDAKYAPERPAE